MFLSTSTHCFDLHLRISLRPGEPVGNWRVIKERVVVLHHSTSHWFLLIRGGMSEVQVAVDVAQESVRAGRARCEFIGWTVRERHWERNLLR